MTSIPKYRYPDPVDLPDRQWPSRVIEKSPEWVSVDLRDGNQALPDPMTPDQKLEYFRLLVKIGFKQIEVAFPSASQDDFDFTRRLIEEGHIPSDVFIMGLTQCRPHLIERTFEAFRGLPRGIVHAYIATSDLHIREVFNQTRAQTLQTAVSATRLIRERCEAMPESDLRYEFSPEEFTDSDPDYALEVCVAVFEAWGRATPERPMILNLPATVERRPPTHYADLIERFIRRFPYRDRVKISLHGHNDQGMVVAATELALLAGADRVEGTLFGHGERTGNLDIVTLALNLHSRGIPIGLDFSNLPHIAETVERLTGLPVYYRQPYSGELVFTAFSGSHQDAINKVLRRQREVAEAFGVGWKVPYLHIDPADIGRKFERLIRINSQSGKGGVAWVLERDHGIAIPKAMQAEVGAVVKAYSDRVHREVNSEELLKLFEEHFVRPQGPFRLIGYWPRPDEKDPAHIHGEARLLVDGVERRLTGEGNGPVSAFVHCLQGLLDMQFTVEDYHEQAIGKGAEAQAAAYVPLKFADGRIVWGVGIDANIDQAAVQAIVSGLNRAAKAVARNGGPR